MKQLLGEVSLYNRITNTYEKGTVCQELDQKNLNDFDQLWKPLLAAQRAKVHTADEAAEADVQDGHWDWVGKARIAAGRMGQETFAVERGETQGLMLIDLNEFARLDTQKGRELIYIDLLATAPWNRKKFVVTPRYKGVGRVLVATAISLSLDSGFHGRIGLHSLPQSESWYRDVAGFVDMGFDTSKRMRYFEATEEIATSFLRKKPGELT